jgi:hypothetical protein
LPVCQQSGQNGLDPPHPRRNGFLFLDFEGAGEFAGVTTVLKIFNKPVDLM